MNYYEVGKIVNTHGIKGELKIISKTDFPEDRFKPGNILYIRDNGKINSCLLYTSPSPRDTR